MRDRHPGLGEGKRRARSDRATSIADRYKSLLRSTNAALRLIVFSEDVIAGPLQIVICCDAAEDHCSLVGGYSTADYVQRFAARYSERWFKPHRVIARHY